MTNTLIQFIQKQIQLWPANEIQNMSNKASIDAAIEVLSKPEEYADNQALAAKLIIIYANKIQNSFITRLFLLLTGYEKQLKFLEILAANSGNNLQKIISHNLQISNSKNAYKRFILEFNEIFGTDPKKMSAPEKRLIEVISERIWNSENIQEKVSAADKYAEYRDLMAKYYKGAHFNFILENEESILSTLKEKVGYTADKQDLGKDQLAARVSSHFVKFVGEQDHVHLAGRQIPETVFHETELAEENGELVSGIRFDMYREKSKSIVLISKRVFWIQTENNPDGPDWISFLKHRSIDFFLYKFRQKLGYKDVNVGPFGYGVGDKNPIIIKNSSSFTP
jgi:hypothetical protein